MLRKGIRVDSVSLSTILGICAKGVSSSVCDDSRGLSTNGQGKLIHNLAIKLGLERDLHLSNSLLD
ncbi:pentatricopeptide repeat-containing protein, partial [Trifolium medium]|nr:pentatricopeptide repeat-containing protein [Trifolium medium]